MFTITNSPICRRGAARALLAGVALCTGIAAQVSHQYGTDERLMTKVVKQKFVTGQTPADLAALRDAGWRITALDLHDAREWRFSAALVRNEGPYRRNWWFGTTFTKTALLNKLGTTGSRLIDVEPVLYRNALYYAAVAVEKLPGDPDSWLETGKSFGELQTIYQARSARIADLERYTPPGASSHVFAAIMVQNTGPHFRKWSWILNATESQLSSALSAKGMRPYDLERTPDDRLDCIMVESGVSMTRYMLAQTEISVHALCAHYGMRVIDVEFAPSTGRFDVVMIRNSLDGSSTPFGGSCIRGLTATARTPSGLPRIGEVLEFRLNADPGIAITGPVTLFIGASRSSLNGLPLPLDLGVLGAPGCQLYTSGEVAVSGLPGANAVVVLVVPDDVALVGARLFSQFLVPVASANPAGFVTTNGVAVVIGGDGF